jgi:hypothetical protein
MIWLTDDELTAVMNAAKPLPPKLRGEFLRAVASEIEHQPQRDLPGLSRSAAPGFSIRRVSAAESARTTEQKGAPSGRVREKPLGAVPSLRGRNDSGVILADSAGRADHSVRDGEWTVTMPSSKGQEFFYLDANGNKSDRDMHAMILGTVKTFPPINEAVMAPIRARNRAKWLAKKERQRQWKRIKAEALAIPVRDECRC